MTICRRNSARRRSWWSSSTGMSGSGKSWSLNAEETASWQRSRSQTATLNRGHNIKYLPYAFTEHGALMVANILNSPRAVAMSVYVIRAFIKMRQDLAANAAILKRLAEIDKTLLVHDTALRDIYQRLRPLLEPAPQPPKPEIGFHIKEDALPYRVTTRHRSVNNRRTGPKNARAIN